MTTRLTRRAESNARWTPLRRALARIGPHPGWSCCVDRTEPELETLVSEAAIVPWTDDDTAAELGPFDLVVIRVDPLVGESDSPIEQRSQHLWPGGWIVVVGTDPTSASCLDPAHPHAPTFARARAGLCAAPGVRTLPAPSFDVELQWLGFAEIDVSAGTRICRGLDRTSAFGFEVERGGLLAHDDPIWLDRSLSFVDATTVVAIGRDRS